MKIFILLVLTVITFAPGTFAQDKKDKIEIGVQATSLSLFHPDFAFDETQMGFGGRVGYNFNRSIAAEAEINFFPQKQFLLGADGNAIQAQFGVKIGKRFEKFGIFGKVRPGFISADRVGSLIPGPAPNGIADFKIERESFFTLDTGGVLELYPSSRTVVRFDAGDTVIRHRAQFGQPNFPTDPSVVQIRPPKFKHNFQFTFGVGFRLGDFPEATTAGTSTNAQEQAPRYEIGVQVTALIVQPRDPNFSVTLPRKHAEPGFGGRFTFNITDWIAAEAEGNYFTRDNFGFPEGGHMFQGQFGAKIGKRFENWGVFGKVRPGFVGFTRVLETPGVQTPPVFSPVTRYYPSLDLGGVVEFYVTRRWMARFDVGDTMIRYAEIRVPPFVVRPQQTRHNLQLTSGIGFRF